MRFNGLTGQSFRPTLTWSKAKDRIPLEADYSRSCEWAFVQVAAWFTQRHGDLRILQHSCPSKARSKDFTQAGQLPSRVPNWAVPFSQMELLMQETCLAAWSAPEHIPQMVTTDGLSPMQLFGPLDFPLDLGIETSAKRIATVWAMMADAKPMDSPSEWRGIECYHPQLCLNKEGPGLKLKEGLGPCQHPVVDFFYQGYPPASDSVSRREYYEIAKKWGGLVRISVGILGFEFLSRPATYLLGTIPSEFRKNAITLPGTRQEQRQLVCLSCKETVPPWLHYRYTDIDSSKILTFIQYLRGHVNSIMTNSVGRDYERKGFAIEHSLGFGPNDLKSGDTVWRLGNEPQLYILRLVTVATLSLALVTCMVP